MKLPKIDIKFVTNFLMGVKSCDEVGVGGALFSKIPQVGDFSYFRSKSMITYKETKMSTAGAHQPTFLPFGVQRQPYTPTSAEGASFLLITFSFSKRYFTPTMRDVYLFYRADIFSRCTKIYPPRFAFSFVRKKSIQTNREINIHLKKKEKEKQTDTEKETDTTSIFLVGPIHVPIHFQGET